MQLQVVDGRTVRREKSRQRIIDAMIRIVSEGEVEATAENVARLAGVTMRTVFRHFDDMESLFREILWDMQAQVDALHVEPNPDQDWREEQEQLILRRTARFEKFLPRGEAAQALRHRSAVIDEDAKHWSRRMRRVIKKILPDHLAAHPMAFEGIDALLSWDMWIRLRRDQGLSARRAAGVVRAAVAAILRDAGSSK